MSEPSRSIACLAFVIASGRSSKRSPTAVKDAYHVGAWLRSNHPQVALEWVKHAALHIWQIADGFGHVLHHAVASVVHEHQRTLLPVCPVRSDDTICLLDNLLRNAGEVCVFNLDNLVRAHSEFQESVAHVEHVFSHCRQVNEALVTRVRPSEAVVLITNEEEETFVGDENSLVRE